ncbi:hypothetical protein BFP72_10085 [Reichenbachiella sp. 5M10]|uniref:cyclic peptide export ABC transporter n=1 Tax=Reichenbachiella sp. 5M10 TaxID=1889772 RepID=UPI000C153B98|nr:cyclic peptide export ABC transporter [Reichenbachiella sp. 5M10]PIB35717.1 hypothetical protein BFP72_10085 [Reichenbachiella sp. 5M10]
MKFLALLKRTSPSIFFFALIVSVISGVCSTYVIQLVHQFAGQGIESDPLFSYKFMGAVILFGITGVLSSYFISVLTQSMIFKLRTELSSKILNASFQKTEKNLDKILPVLTADINFVSASMNRLPPVVTGLATAIGCIVYMFILSWKMTLGSMALFGISFIVNYLALPYLKKYSEAARDVWDKIHKNFEGVVYGMKELKLNKQHRVNFIQTNIGPNCEEENKYRVKEEVLYAVSSRIVEMILLMGIGIFIINMASIPWMDKDEFGDFLLVLLFTVAPLATVSGFLKHIKRTQVSLKKIDDIGVSLVEEPDFETKELDYSKWNPATDPLFSFQNVFFSYDSQSEDEKFSIGPINLDVKKQEIIYVIGGNGSGKTTFIKMLTGLYVPTQGDIKLKGQDITEEQLDNYRKHFAGVFTDYYLFDDLMHIDPSIVDREANNLLKELEIDHKVKITDGHISTTQLSYGQRKRLAMMVAILEDKDVYIFDEWAANQDPYFKEIFYVRILPQLKAKGKTIIAISHDEKYFEHADRVVKMMDGQLIEVKH